MHFDRYLKFKNVCILSRALFYVAYYFCIKRIVMNQLLNYQS